MNLLMIGSDPSVAQGQQSTHYHMLREFARYWTRIDYLCPPGVGAIPRQVHGNVFVHPSPWPGARYPLYVLRKGRALLAERDYALVTTQDYGFFGSSLAAAQLMRGRTIPLVSELHHIEGYPRATTLRERLYRWLAMRYIPFMTPRVAAFRVVNHVEMPDLLRKLRVPEEKILILPALYMDYDTFQPGSGEPLKQFDLLYVGRLAPNKGLFTILDALHRLRQSRPHTTLAIRGDGPLRAALQQRIVALELVEAVTWIPRLDQLAQLADLYRAARALVCASTAEGGPRVTVEAMACGTPVITTPVGVMRELVKDDVNGLVFNGDAAGLAACAARLLEDEALQQRLGEAGQTSARGFSAQDVIARYAEGLHALVRRAG